MNKGGVMTEEAINKELSGQGFLISVPVRNTFANLLQI